MIEALLAGRLRRTALIIALSVLLTAPAWRDATADEYPSRTVSLVVAYPAGGGVDTVGRVIAQKLTERARSAGGGRQSSGRWLGDRHSRRREGAT